MGDEMHIREGLVFKRNSSKLVGFCDMGNINNHLLELESQYQSDTNTRKLATTILVIMVRGLFTYLNFPYASFPTRSLKGDQLVPIFYEAVLRVERCGLHVLGITLDGNSVNRLAWNLAQV